MELLDRMEHSGGSDIPEGYGLRKVPIHFKTILLDTEKLQEDSIISVTLPTGTSIREAKEMLHKTMAMAKIGWTWSSWKLRGLS